MSHMDRRMANELDRYITGNYGEDQHREYDAEENNARLRETFGARSPYGIGERNVKVLLGLDPKAKWPVEGMGMRVVNGWKVWVDPLVGEVQRNGWRAWRRSNHRAKAECPTCGQVMSAGRVHQHVCKGGK